MLMIRLTAIIRGGKKSLKIFVEIKLMKQNLKKDILKII